MRILSVGEILWDVFPDREQLGGAALNLAFHLARLGHHVAMVSAVGEDDRGDRAMEIANNAGIETEFVERTKAAPTGIVRVSLDARGQPSYVLERPAAYDYTNVTPAIAEALKAWNPRWICFGTLFHKTPEVLHSTARLLAACPDVGRYYDVNLRPGSYSARLVRHLASLANILKLSEEEAPEVARLLDLPYAGREAFLRRLAETFDYRAVCLTRGKNGCAVLWQGVYAEYASLPVKVADAVGAGDAFAAAFLHGWLSGWNQAEAAGFANSVGGLIASRAGGTPEWSPTEVL